MMKKVLFFYIIILGSCSKSNRTIETKLPIEVVSGKIKSDWILADSTKTKVMLESGFPEIILNEEFVNRNIKDFIRLKREESEATIATWGSQILDVSYRLSGEILINGIKQNINALVANLSPHQDWSQFDMIFPIGKLEMITEINIKENYMVINKTSDNYFDEFQHMDVNFHKGTMGLYLNSSLEVFDTLGNHEKLEGNYLLDLGGANALYLNKNKQEVLNFLNKSKRMLLTDTSRFTPNPKTELEILIPQSFKLNEIEIHDNFIVCMKMYSSINSEFFVGTVGNKFFENIIIIFDFKNEKIHWKPNSDKINMN